MSESETSTIHQKRNYLQSICRAAASTQGFTLVELVLIIVLLAVVSVSFLPKFFDTSGVSLVGATAMVTADIRYAQELAMGTHEDKEVVFTAPNPYYTVALKTVNLPSSVSILTGETFRFNALGEPVNALGEIITTGSTYVEIQGGSECKKICVENYTGNASVVYPCTDPCP